MRATLILSYWILDSLELAELAVSESDANLCFQRYFP
jgi:hypothetical protein